MNKTAHVGLILSFLAIAVFEGPNNLAGGERSVSVRNQYLVDLGKCPSIADCKAPKGHHVDHLIPLWAGGADHVTNLKLVREDVHKKKTATEAKLRAEFQKTGVLDLRRLPALKEGRFGAKVVNVRPDFSVIVEVNLRRARPSEGLGKDQSVLLRIPLAGLKPVEKVSSKRNQYKEMRELFPKDSQLTMKVGGTPQLRFPVPTPGNGDIGTIPSFRTEPGALWKGGDSKVSQNQRAIESGIAAYDGEQMVGLPRATTAKLAKANQRAKSDKAGLWSTLHEFKERERKAEQERKKRERQARIAQKKAEKERKRREREERREAKRRERSIYGGSSYGGSSGSSWSDGGGGGGGRVKVRGYSRKDGTYVRPHTRSRPGKFGF